MTIKSANSNDFENVMQFYYDLIESMQNAEFRPGWKKDIYPTRQFIRDSIVKNELFIAIMDESIVGSMIMNHDYADGYSKIKWKITVEKMKLLLYMLLGFLNIIKEKELRKKWLSMP